MPTNYQLTTNYLSSDNSLGKAEIKWAAFNKAHTYGQWIMLHVSDSSFYPLDTSKIQLPNTDSQLLLLLQQHNIPLNPKHKA
jgi:hypothetical protein